MTQKALIIDVCRGDKDSALLIVAHSITELSDSVKERVEAEYVKREASGEAPMYAGPKPRLHDPKYHAHGLLRDYINEV